MNKCPEEWKYQKEGISSHEIMEILQSSWHGCFKITSSKKMSDIRVLYNKGMCVCRICEYHKLLSILYFAEQLLLLRKIISYVR